MLEFVRSHTVPVYKLAVHRSCIITMPGRRLSTIYGWLVSTQCMHGILAQCT